MSIAGAGHETVDGRDESFEQVGQLHPFVGRVHPHQVCHQSTPALCHVGVAGDAGFGDRHHHHPTVVVARVARGEARPDESLDRTGRCRGVDAKRIGEFAHPPIRLLCEQIERVHLALLEGVIATAEEVIAQGAHRRAPAQLDPCKTDAHRKLNLLGIGQVDVGRAWGTGCTPRCAIKRVTVQGLDGRHVGVRVATMSGDDDRSPAGQTPLELLGVIATQDVMLTPTLRHVEMFSMRGLLTVLWHEPSGTDEPSAALVLCGGAMGGLLGPADGLYHRLGVAWADRGVPVLRVSYRRPNDLDACCIDVAAAVQLAVGGAGAQRVVVMGHSFGGAVAVRVAVGLDEMVAGVVTFATQSAGCEVAGGLAGRPLLLFHGDRDEILAPEASEMVRMIAGTGEVVRLPGDGHLLAKSGDVMWERLETWLPEVLGIVVE